jgi:hypothetical protein
METGPELQEVPALLRLDRRAEEREQDERAK